jgi:endonuclease/exonuclease/phosphatase family metal-dependent hydrolase
MSLSSLMLLATLAGGPPAEPKPDVLRTMSFNIRYGTAEDGPDHWNHRRSRVFRLLEEHPADLIGLQEALSFQIEELRRERPFLRSIGVGRDDGRNAGEFSAILYDERRLEPLRTDTFWFSDSPQVPGSRHWGNRVTRICTWAFFRDRESGRFFYVYNLHLDHESQPSREKSVELLLERVRNRGTDDPVVIMGDFNVGETNPVIATLRGAGFQDTFRILHPEATDVGTFNAFRDQFQPDKIDAIFVDHRWKTLSAEIVRSRYDGRWPSDHAPVTATLRLEEP